MPDLALERATDGGEHYEILDEARNVVGHIMLSDAAPVEMPWIWTIVGGHISGVSRLTATKPHATPPCRPSLRTGIGPADPAKQPFGPVARLAQVQEPGAAGGGQGSVAQLCLRFTHSASDAQSSATFSKAILLEASTASAARSLASIASRR
jgi:hypothetical protein